MYTKQSLHVFDRDVKYQEGFQSVSDVIKNGAIIIGAPTFSNGVVTLDGSADAFNINHVLQRVRSDTVGTFIARVSPVDATPLGFESIISFGDTNANTHILFYINNNGSFIVTFVRTGVTHWQITTTNPAFSDNTFTEIAVVQDGTSPVLYVDGVDVAQSFLVNTNTTRWFNFSPELDNARIGNRNVNSGGESDYFTGDVDWVEIYDRALSADEIASHFANRLYIPPPIANQVLAINPSLSGVFTDRWGNTVTNNSVTVVNDGGFMAGEYDGSSSFLNIDAVLSASLATTTTGTWIAWIKPVDATPAGNERFISFGDTNADTRINVDVLPAQTFRAIVRITGTTQWQITTDAAAFTDNMWTHITLVQNGTSPVLYIDSVAVATTIAGPDETSWFNNLSGLDNGRLGSINFNSAGESNHFNGRLGPVKLYDTNLSAALIERDYLSTKQFYNR